MSNTYGRGFTQRQLEKRAAARKASGRSNMSAQRQARQAEFRRAMNMAETPQVYATSARVRARGQARQAADAAMRAVAGLQVDNTEYDAARQDMAEFAADASDAPTVAAEPRFRRLRQKSNPRSAPKQTSKTTSSKPASRPSGPKPKSKSTQRKDREGDGGARKKCGGGKPVSVIAYQRNTGRVVTHCRGTPF